MDIVSLIIGLAVAFILFKLLKASVKLLVNGIIGVILLWVVNLFGFGINITLINAIIAGIFGIPGVVVIVVLKLFGIQF